MTGTYSVVDRETRRVLASGLTLSEAARTRDALTTTGDPVIVSGDLCEGDTLAASVTISTLGGER